jgi:hypothetical protein
VALEAELDATRVRASAEQQAADSGRSSLARERAALEEQRRGAAEVLRQLEAREDSLAQVGGCWVGDASTDTSV